ncbi:hypothetical protein LOAG_12046, partial [Loa loa]
IRHSVSGTGLTFCSYGSSARGLKNLDGLRIKRVPSSAWVWSCPFPRIIPRRLKNPSYQWIYFVSSFSCDLLTWQILPEVYVIANIARDLIKHACFSSAIRGFP